MAIKDILSAIYLNKLIVKVSGIVGSIFTLTTVCLFFYTTNWISDSYEVKGTVIGHDESQSTRSSHNGSSPRMFSVIYEYFDENGKRHETISSLRTSKKYHNSGDEISILVKKNSGNDSKVNSFFEIWLPVVALGAFGAISIIVSLTVSQLLRVKKKL